MELLAECGYVVIEALPAPGHIADRVGVGLNPVAYGFQFFHVEEGVPGVLDALFDVDVDRDAALQVLEGFGPVLELAGGEGLIGVRHG